MFLSIILKFHDLFNDKIKDLIKKFNYSLEENFMLSNKDFSEMKIKGLNVRKYTSD